MKFWILLQLMHSRQSIMGWFSGICASTYIFALKLETYEDNPPPNIKFVPRFLSSCTYTLYMQGARIFEKKNNVLPECVYCRYWRTNKIQIKILYELKNIYFLTSEIFCLLYEFNWPVSDKRDGSNADSECNIANYTMLEIG